MKNIARLLLIWLIILCFSPFISYADEPKVYNVDNSQATVLLFAYRVSEKSDDIEKPWAIKNNDKLSYKDFKVKLFDLDLEKEKDVFRRHGYRIVRTVLGGIVLKDEYFDLRERVYYPKDINAKIAKTVSDIFNDNKCNVIDISELRSSLNNLTVEDIIKKYREKYNFDCLVLAPYQAYSKVDDSRSGGQTKYGLLVYMQLHIINPITYYSIAQGWEEVNIYGEWTKERKIGEADIDWIEPNHFGIMRDDLTQQKVLDNIKFKQTYKYYNGYMKIERQTIGLQIEKIVPKIVSSKPQVTP
jgi:hypothetical protein